MLRVSTLVGSMILGLAVLVSTGATQDTKKPKVKGFLPPGFKALGLSKEQVLKIYTVQTEYRGKIADLQNKINELKKQQSQDEFKVLTEEQREKYLKSKGLEVKKKAAEKKAPNP